LAGGLAAEVRDWLVNIESSLPSSAAERRKDDPWSMKVVVDDISGGRRAGMILVRGMQAHTDDSRTEVGGGVVDNLEVVKIILAGEGAGMGLQKGSKVEVGKLVGIKAPMWEVVIEAEKWGVGVDWKVLS